MLVCQLEKTFLLTSVCNCQCTMDPIRQRLTDNLKKDAEQQLIQREYVKQCTCRLLI